MSRDQTLLVPLTLVVCMVLLFVSFRWWPAVVFPIVAVGVTALLVVGGMGLVGEELNILNNIIPPLLIIIGVSDSIHLIGRYREEVRAGEGAVAATSTTVRAMAVACLLTSVTTAVGLASLAVSNTPMLQRFGVTAAIGVMLAYVVTIAFLPATITFFRPPAQPGSDESASAGRFLENLVVGLTRAVIARPLAVLAGAAVLFGLALWSTTAVEVDTSLLDSFEEGDPAFDTTHLLEEKLDGIRPLEVILEAGGDTTFHEPELLAAVDHVSTWLREQPGVLRVTSASDWLHELWFLLTGDPAARDAGFRTRAQVQAFGTLMAERDPDPLAFYLSEDARIARIEVKMRDAGARAITDVVSGLETELDEAFAGTDVRAAMTGDAYTGSLGIATVVDDLLGSLTVAVLIIFAMLALLFRSVRLGLLSIPPNGLPLLCAVGWMVLRGIPLNIATAIIFSISIGLAVDGTIHVLARFREERTSGRDIDTSLLRAAAGTGRAIVVSSATLTLGFGVLLFSSFVPVRIFGELIAVTVASCLVATLVLQPALLKVGAPRDTGER